MVRKHGWQLPAHTFQIVAITVFCSLVVAFYAFFAPFLGGHIWKYALIGIYSPVVLLVFILYVRCTAINPADPGIMSRFNTSATNKPNEDDGLPVKDSPGKVNDVGSEIHSSPSVSRHSRGSGQEVEAVDAATPPPARKRSFYLAAMFCSVFAHEDCRKQEGREATGEDALYCTLCNSEVRKFSKHCRSCDKCVDGFDHHCRWLNNCVGYRNYVTFISLMATSLVWLVLEAGVGIAVIVRCFVNKKAMNTEIVDTLGNGFSRALFATIVCICTFVSILAWIPLGELFFFHMILIRKGITTYEYVVAMREMSEAPPAEEEDGAGIVAYTPTGSTTTGFSGGSSLGLPYKGAWCTPPRVFVDYQEEVVPHLGPGRVPSTVDPDADGVTEKGNKAPKKPVRISAWKLAKLDSTDAMRAAAKARASSSVMKTLDNRRGPVPDGSSSGNLSVRSSVSTDMGPNKEFKDDVRLSQVGNVYAPSQGSRDEYETGTQSVSSFSSPSHIHESVTLSPLPQAQGHTHISHDYHTTSKAPARGFDETIMQKGNTSADPLLLSAPATSLLRDMRRTSVVWDQEAGRYISVPVSASSDAWNRPSMPMGLQKSSLEATYPMRKPVIPSQGESSSAAKLPAQQAEKLTYTGDSIFFGGPLLSVPVRDGASSSSEGQHRLALNLPQDTRYKRDSVSNQLPVFNPGGFDHNPSSGSGLR